MWKRGLCIKVTVWLAKKSGRDSWQGWRVNGSKASALETWPLNLSCGQGEGALTVLSFSFPVCKTRLWWEKHRGEAFLVS